MATGGILLSPTDTASLNPTVPCRPLCIFGEEQFTDATQPVPPDVSAEPFPWLDRDLSNELQSLEAAQFTFTDDSIIEVPLFKLMRAGLNVAKALQSAQNIWDPSASHVIDASILPFLSLPPNFFPVRTQLTIPHHPLFDIFPWPVVREKLIQVFALPAELRPPSAKDPMAIMNMVYDIDDDHEGFKITGSEGLDGQNWEIGQRFFRNWWWALDQDCVRQSNDLRIRRGAARLSLDTIANTGTP